MNTTTTTTATVDGTGKRVGAPEQERAPGNSGPGQCVSKPRRQVRLRLTPTVAGQLHALNHKARAEVVALIVNAALAGIDVKQLLGARQELRNLGLLINQSLRVSRGTETNVVVLNQAVEVINNLTKK